MTITVDSPARDQAEAVRRREISARELLDLHLERIAALNPQLTAIVSLDEERARAGAAAADDHLARGWPVGPLHGLPFAVKDTHDVAGWRTTYGSPLFADHVPDRDDLVVERVRRAGAVLIGRTNVPEFAAGSHTFNRVFGTTRNPRDPSRSAGGSSGGAAAALAAGMVPLADGSDTGGSLRNPASFCGVVGLRPSLGRVPSWPVDNQWETTTVSGPLARDVGDVALLLSVMAGPDPRVPMALGNPGHTFLPPLHGSLVGLKVGWTSDLGGLLEVDTQVAAVVEEAGPDDGPRRRPRLRRPPRPRAGRRHLPHAARLELPGRLRRAAPRAPRRTQAEPRRQRPGRRVADRRRRRPGVRPAHRALGDDAASSSPTTTCWRCRSRRCRRSRPRRSTPGRSTARPMADYLRGCGRPT